MKKIILTITLLFFHVSFGLDALDGKSILCLNPNGDDGPIHFGHRFVGHSVIGDVFVTTNDEVTIKRTYGWGDFSETNLGPVNDISADYISFWRIFEGTGGRMLRLNRETLKLEYRRDGELKNTSSCEVYASTEDYFTDMEAIRRQLQETYNKKLEKNKV